MTGERTMMRHPELERLRALTAGELTGEPARSTAQHVAGCDACREKTQWLDAVRGAAREPLAEPAPENWARIVERLDAGEVVLLPAEAPRHARGVIGSRALRVAGVALLLAGGAVAALPDGWLRSWVGEVLLQSGNADATTGAEDSVAPAPVPAQVTLIVEARANAVLVTMAQPHEAVTLRVQLADTEDVEVHATGGAAAARFLTAPGRLSIADAGAGEIVLAIPRSLARLRLEVDGRAYLIKDRDQIRILAPVADTSGSEFILPVRPRTATSQ